MKRTHILVVIMLLLLGLLACAPAQPAPEAAPQAPAAEEQAGQAPAPAVEKPPVIGGKCPAKGGTLRAAFQNEWESLDPHVTSSYSSYQILNNVLDGLTFYDNNLNHIPWLATSWEREGNTWTFHLRQGVKFSNGREMTAEDVKFSWERLINPETGSGNAARVGPPDTVIEVVDDYTLRVTHPELFGIFPQSIGFDKSTGIIARESLEEDGTITIPIGTGPYKITEVQGTTRLVLERNEFYWQEDYPCLDRIVIEPIPDDTVRETALRGGEVDWVLAIAPQNFQSLQEDPKIVVDTAPQLSYDYIGVNLKREPLSDVRIRHAIAHTIDRQQICEAAYFGLCTPIQGPTGPGTPWYFDYAPYDHNPQKAKDLLAEAGYPDGFEMELMPTTQYGETVRAAQVIQQQLAEIGIDASINALEWSEWLEKEGNFQYDTYICNWNGLIDADQYYYLQHHTGEVFNFTGYSNPEFDRLVEEGRMLSDFEKRYPIYEKANKILVDDAPYIYMYNKKEIRAYAPHVKGFAVRPDQANNFWTVWLEQ